MNLDACGFRPSAGLRRWARILCAVGAATLVVSAFFAPQRSWANLLLSAYLLLGMGLGATFFVALGHVTGARWSVAFRRVPEAIAGVLPAAAIGLGAIFLLRPSLYPWTGAVVHAAGFKGAWLSLPFFYLRAAIYLALWIYLARRIVHASQRQDRDGPASDRSKMIRPSALFLVAFGLTFWLASIDWIMSLEPDWYSTVFGVYNFAGLFTGSLALIILLVIWLGRASVLRDFVTEEHLHDLGKLLFSFTTFWMYIWFCQYMLIWYANIPEETHYYVARLHGFWEPLFLLNILLNWVVPFLVLQPKRTKRSTGTLAKVAIVVLAGRWLDLYLMILPRTFGATPLFGVAEMGAILGVAGLLFLLFCRTLGRAPLVPLNDPFLRESLEYHN